MSVCAQNYGTRAPILQYCLRAPVYNEYATDIYGSGKRLLKVINEIKTLAKEGLIDFIDK